MGSVKLLLLLSQFAMIPLSQTISPASYSAVLPELKFNSADTTLALSDSCVFKKDAVLKLRGSKEKAFASDERIWVREKTLSVNYWDSDPRTDNSVKAYPNPSNSEIHLAILPPQTIMSVQFYNIMGIALFPDYYKSESNSVTVNVRPLAGGTYIARIAWSEGSVSGIKVVPFIVNH